MYFEKVHMYFFICILKTGIIYSQVVMLSIGYCFLCFLPSFFWPVSIFQFVYSEHTMNKPSLVV